MRVEVFPHSFVYSLRPTDARLHLSVSSVFSLFFSQFLPIAERVCIIAENRAPKPSALSMV